MIVYRRKNHKKVQERYIMNQHHPIITEEKFT